MPTLAVFAHFDPGGQVAPHVLRYVRALAEVAERTVVVSAGELSAAGRDALEARDTGVEVVTRENVGYDFFSWKTGLDHVGDWEGYDRVVLANDSVVGPLQPLRHVLGPGAPKDVDFWGMTVSRELSPHVQSWFTVYERGALRSGLLQGFWRAMQPETDRYRVIRRYELGMSRLLLTAGLRMGAYLRPTRADLVRAQVRYRHALRERSDLAASVRRASAGRGRLARHRDLLIRPAYNPSYVFWDTAFRGRLPFVKIEILRDDPYRMGNERILLRLERAHPEAMAGVRAYIDRTREQVRALRGIG
jgi:lipopolysaccharide biosynthesis protein